MAPEDRGHALQGPSPVAVLCGRLSEVLRTGKRHVAQLASAARTVERTLSVVGSGELRPWKQFTARQPMGNTHRVRCCHECGVTHTQQEAVNEFAAMFESDPFLTAMTIVAIKRKNRACWCKPGEHCHADFLLSLANR
jgi:ribosomal protein L44E